MHAELVAIFHGSHGAFFEIRYIHAGRNIRIIPFDFSELIFAKLRELRDRTACEPCVCCELVRDLQKPLRVADPVAYLELRSGSFRPGHAIK